MRSLVVTLAACGGCMEIYPDPELPDVRVDWLQPLDLEPPRDGSEPGTPAALRVVIDDMIAGEAAVDAGSLRIRDLSRDYHAVRGIVLDAAGSVIAGSDTGTVDLRDGTGRSTQVGFFLTDSGITDVTWQLSADASCASLGAVQFEVAYVAGESRFGTLLPCDDRFMASHDYVVAGTYQVHVEAQRDDGSPVARSDEAAVTIPRFGDHVAIGPLLVRSR